VIGGAIQLYVSHPAVSGRNLWVTISLEKKGMGRFVDPVALGFFFRSYELLDRLEQI